VHQEAKASALDEWLEHFQIPCLQRHQAAADALATAELLLRLWPRLRRETGGELAALERLAASRHWLQA
jgi:DNA polymerase-3 subunit epsilon